VTRAPKKTTAEPAEAASAAGSGASQKEVARVLGITAREIRNLHDRGLPFKLGKNGRREYDLGVVVPWYVKFKAETEKREDPEQVKRAELSRRKLETEVRTGELELAKLEGSLVTIDYLEAQLSRSTEAVRARIMGLPGRAGPHLVGCKTTAEVQIRVQELVDELLTGLSDLGDAEDLDVDDDDVDAASA
jgi:phage terminase Nu1 subunit (DNA packaging protein)